MRRRAVSARVSMAYPCSLVPRNIRIGERPPFCMRTLAKLKAVQPEASDLPRRGGHLRVMTGIAYVHPFLRAGRRAPNGWR